jgi:hypothetical protein
MLKPNMTAQHEEMISALLAHEGFTFDEMALVSLDYGDMSAHYICLENDGEEEAQYFFSQVSTQALLRGVERSGMTGLDADTLIDYIAFKIGDWTMIKV